MNNKREETSWCDWPLSPGAPQVAPGEVHVWCAELSSPGATEETLLELLSEDERERASRYLFERHRLRFIASRAAQRLILAPYVNLAPQELRFVYTPLGKPAFAENDARGLQFNVSNSGLMALVAVGHARELGVDLEFIRDNLDHAGLAKRFFAAEERERLAALPEHLQLRGFFDCWTRKEAFLKAIGKGLTFPLDRAVVSVEPWAPCRLIALDGSEAEAAAWSLRNLAPAAGYVGALALRGELAGVQTYRFCWG